MTKKPDRAELAKELCESAGECGQLSEDRTLVCTKPRGHGGKHGGQPVDRVVPF